MPRSTRRPAARPVTGEGRAGILQAAIREFAEQGFSGATTAQIARKAKVTQPLVHHHFGSKRKLWDAALAELFTPLREQLLAARAEAESLPRVDRLTIASTPSRCTHSWTRWCARSPRLACARVSFRCRRGCA